LLIIEFDGTSNLFRSDYLCSGFGLGHKYHLKNILPQTVQKHHSILGVFYGKNEGFARAGHGRGEHAPGVPGIHPQLGGEGEEMTEKKNVKIAFSKDLEFAFIEGFGTFRKVHDETPGKSIKIPKIKIEEKGAIPQGDKK